MVSQDRDIRDGFAARQTAKGRQPPLYLQRLFERVDPFELRLVRRLARTGSQPDALRLALFMNRLGDGWIYPILALLVLSFPGWSPVKVTLTALFAAGFAHIVYPLIKRYLARPRPFEKDLSLIVAAAPLDRYSCPSGHVMTATAVFLPFALTSLPLACGLLVIWCLLGWARIILGHHYASDVGVAVGAASAALSWTLLTPGLFSLFGPF